MLAATMVKMSNSEKKYMNKNTYNISSIKRNQEVSGSFMLQSCKTMAKKYRKKCAACQKLLFCLLDLLLFSHHSHCLCHLALHNFIFYWSKLQILPRASLVALAKSIYYISVTSVKGTPIFRGKGHSFLVLTSSHVTLLY